MTPFKALYGRDPPALQRPVLTNNEPVDLLNHISDRELVLHQLKQNLHKAQQRMKAQADKRRMDMQLAVGDMVLAKLQPYRQHSVALRRNQKLSMRYFGPFEVIQRIGQVAYKLKLPDQAKIHPVFHISQLKKFQGDDTVAYLPLPLLTAENGPIVQPKEVLQTRMLLRNESQIPQALILWDDDDVDAASWEDIEEFKRNYPLSNLEDLRTRLLLKGMVL